MTTNNETKCKCTPKCIFFPNDQYNSRQKYETDEFGVKHSTHTSRHLCGYDFHEIKKWDECSFYKETLEQEEENKENIIVILGKSSAGKDTLLEILSKKYEFNPIVSHTTRPIRENETNGIDYFFVSRRVFRKMSLTRKFIETREYHTLFNNEDDIWYYGISKKEFDNKNRKICVVDDIGLTCLSDYYGRENICTIYLDTDEEIRKDRAIIRGSFSTEEWERRKTSDNLKFTDDYIRKNMDFVLDNNKSMEELERNAIEYLKTRGFFDGN